jgi:hypothetical protein
MRPNRFLISSLLIAGLIPPQAARAAIAPDFSLEPDKHTVSLFEVFKRDHLFDLAAHRSHSSHGSHASHQSHRSSTGGGYVAPIYTPPPVITTPPPRTGVPPGNAAKLMNIVIQVQTALYTYGYYSGPFTGIVDGPTKAALADMQAQFGLPVTGKITPDVLDALGVTAE